MKNRECKMQNEAERMLKRLAKQINDLKDRKDLKTEKREWCHWVDAGIHDGGYMPGVNL